MQQTLEGVWDRLAPSLPMLLAGNAVCRLDAAAVIHTVCLYVTRCLVVH